MNDKVKVEFLGQIKQFKLKTLRSNDKGGELKLYFNGRNDKRNALIGALHQPQKNIKVTLEEE